MYNVMQDDVGAALAGLQQGIADGTWPVRSLCPLSYYHHAPMTLALPTGPGQYGAFVTALVPGHFPIFLPHFLLYKVRVVSLHMCVLPYKYGTILERLLKLTKVRDITGSRRTSARVRNRP